MAGKGLLVVARGSRHFFSCIFWVGLAFYSGCNRRMLFASPKRLNLQQIALNNRQGTREILKNTADLKSVGLSGQYEAGKK